jgi:hypothetical protein
MLASKTSVGQGLLFILFSLTGNMLFRGRINKVPPEAI